MNRADSFSNGEYIKTKKPQFPEAFLAVRTGLEPATTGVTGRYSNQLNYHSKVWWVLRGSNPRPSPCKGDALPAELSTRYLVYCYSYFESSFTASLSALPALKP